MDEELEELLQIGDELHQKHSQLESNYNVRSGAHIDLPLSFEPSFYIGFCKSELKHPAEIILDYIKYIDDWTEFLNHTEWNFERMIDDTDTVEELLELSENEELKKLSKEEVSKRFYADSNEIHTGYQNIRDRLEDLLPDILEEGDELWSRQVELNTRYKISIHSDGGATRSLEKYWYEEDSEKFKKAYQNYIKGCMKELRKSKTDFKKRMKKEGDEWKDQLCDELLDLSKEQVIQKFEKEYSSLLSDYEKLNRFISREDICLIDDSSEDDDSSQQTDTMEDIKELTEKAEAGDKDAQFELALRYYNIYNPPKLSDDVDFDILDCIDWMTKSAEQGDIRSQRELGKLCYENNLGYHDYEKAYIWLKKAAKAGDLEAKIWLAKYYRNEETFYSDPKKAVKLLRSAIKEFSIDEFYDEAVYELGMCYLTGYGVRRECDKAYYWFKIGADGCHAKSCLSLGVCYMLGQGTDKNPPVAYDYISKARDLAENERKDLPDAEYLLGICYYYGIGVEKDYKKAFKQFSKISDSCSSVYSMHAVYMIGELYYHGRGVRKNREKAFDHYSAVASAEPENEKAAYALGRCYANGHGVEKNRDKAIYWYTRAEVAGSYKAEEEVYLLIEGKEKPKYSATMEYSSRCCGVVTGHRKLTPEEKESAKESSRRLKEHFGIIESDEQ